MKQARRHKGALWGRAPQITACAPQAGVKFRSRTKNTSVRQN